MCCRQITLRTDFPTESARQQRVRSLDQGFSPAEGTPTLKSVVLSVERVGQQIKNGAMARRRVPLHGGFCYPFVDPFH